MDNRIRQNLREIFGHAPESYIDAWHDAIYGDPEITSIEGIMKFTLERMTMSDIAKLTTVFNTKLSVGIDAAKTYFWRLLNIAEFDPAISEYKSWVVEHPEDRNLMTEGSMLTYLYEMDVLGNLTLTRFLINPRQFVGHTVGEIILAVAHEAWHGLQAVTTSRTVRSGGDQIPLMALPRDLQRSQLHLVNMKNIAEPGIDGVAIYQNQLVEKEAFRFQEYAQTRIQSLILEYHSIGTANRLNRMITR